MVEGLQARGVFFRSLRDPVNTASPQGLFTLQVLSAAAQLERALIRGRTRSGMRAAAARGARPGNPGLRAGDPAARRASYLAGLVAGLDGWLPQVRQLRADGRPWDGVVRYLNARRPAAGGAGLGTAVSGMAADSETGLVAASKQHAPDGPFPGKRVVARRPLCGKDASPGA